MGFTLTDDNYYSSEANKRFISVSQYKDFAGTLGHTGCEYEALQKINDTAFPQSKKALILGSYVDRYFEGTQEQYIEENRSSIFQKPKSKTAKPEKYKDFIDADYAIARAEKDPYFMKYMAGDKQTILTAEVAGAEWKIKMDSYLENKAIVDLKYMKSVRELEWSPIVRKKLDFIRYYGYDIQGAIYQEVVFQNTGKRLPFYIAAITKETPNDIAIIQVTQNYLDDAMSRVKENIDRIIAIKRGDIEPVMCGECATCRRDKVLSAPIGIDDLMKREENFK